MVSSKNNSVLYVLASLFLVITFFVSGQIAMADDGGGISSEDGAQVNIDIRCPDGEVGNCECEGLDEPVAPSGTHDADVFIDPILRLPCPVTPVGPILIIPRPLPKTKPIKICCDCEGPTDLRPDVGTFMYQGEDNSVQISTDPQPCLIPPPAPTS